MLGLVVYKYVFLFNYLCVFNCYMYWENGDLLFTICAFREIVSGEEFTIMYVDVDFLCDVRCVCFVNFYVFDCVCFCCVVGE